MPIFHLRPAILSLSGPQPWPASRWLPKDLFAIISERLRCWKRGNTENNSVAFWNSPALYGCRSDLDGAMASSQGLNCYVNLSPTSRYLILVSDIANWSDWNLLHPQSVFYFDSPMPVSTKWLVHNHMICNHTIGTGMAPTIFWSARAEGAVFWSIKHNCLDPDGWLMRVKDHANHKQK